MVGLFVPGVSSKEHAQGLAELDVSSSVGVEPPGGVPLGGAAGEEPRLQRALRRATGAGRGTSDAGRGGFFASSRKCPKSPTPPPTPQ